MPPSTNLAAARLRPLLGPTTGLEDEVSTGADVSAYPKDETGQPTNTAPLNPPMPPAGGMGGEPPADGGPTVPVQDSDATGLPTDLVGDIPPPPVPQAPAIVGSGVGGIMGTKAGTLSRPGTRGAMPFRTQAFNAPSRFGPGAPMVGGSSTAVSGLPDAAGGSMTPEEAAELLARMASGGR